MNTCAGCYFVELFNSPLLNWLGWVSRLPITEDYVPVFPWLGLMWWGAATGGWLMRQNSARLAATLQSGLKPLALLGRHSLTYYMVHQPVLIGLVMGARWLIGMLQP
jgi:uncharacterized membrane protein